MIITYTNKPQIRNLVKNAFTNYKHKTLTQYSWLVNKNLLAYLNTLDLKNQSLAAYCSIKSEINIIKTLKSIASYNSNTILLPKIHKDLLVFNKFNFNVGLKEQTSINQYNIPEIITTDTVIPNIIIAPMLAFNMQGLRVGYGKGYYDKTLATLKKNNKILYIGVAYSFQEYKNIITTPNDVNLDIIITNNLIHTVK